MTEKSHKKTALIVGATRGLGLALAAEYIRRRWHVIATVRQAMSISRIRSCPGRSRVRLVNGGFKQRRQGAGAADSQPMQVCQCTGA